MAVACSGRPSMAEKGHFVVISEKQNCRPPIPIGREELGLQSNGPLKLPCDANYMEHVISFLLTRATIRRSSSSYLLPEYSNWQFVIYGKDIQHLTG
uniref:Uncharacterized protein n=1 Tax=Salix viminalis TaxID=40686 RepID=A0A6N2KLQ1_SALVM